MKSQMKESINIYVSRSELTSLEKRNRQDKDGIIPSLTLVKRANILL